MGRRKIEIQPITHERNRSVTFLKRKNGLFKKAYELGVLCSVDVAVIIFEERPGHHVKLYEYCSGKVKEIVQRHSKYDGDKEARGPQDFSGGNSKLIDEDGGDDEDEEETVVPSKRRGPGKLRPVDTSVSEPAEVELGLSPMPQPPFPTEIPTLPVSSLRHHPLHASITRHGGASNKKARVEPSPPPPSSHNQHSRSSSGASVGGPGPPPFYQNAPYSSSSVHGPYFPSGFHFDDVGGSGSGGYRGSPTSYLPPSSTRHGPGPGNEIFGFLDDTRGGGGGSGFDWPVHHHPNSTQQSQRLHPPVRDGPGWLDFLNGNGGPGGSGGGGGGGSGGGNEHGSRPGTSWERGGPDGVDGMPDSKEDM